MIKKMRRLTAIPTASPVMLRKEKALFFQRRRKSILNELSCMREVLSPIDTKNRSKIYFIVYQLDVLVMLFSNRPISIQWLPVTGLLIMTALENPFTSRPG